MTGTPETGSVLIDNMVIPLDWNHQVDDFLKTRLPPEQLLFARHTEDSSINPLSCGNTTEYLKPPYPPLPPIQIGEYQCPTGMSRYGRALFLVDWPVLRKIAIKCWGFPSDGQKPKDIPEKWQYLSGNVPKQYLTLQFKAESVLTFGKMFPLVPHRIIGASVELWALPLVDVRYFLMQNIASEVWETGDDHPESWGHLFKSMVDFLNSKEPGSMDPIVIDPESAPLVDPKYGLPDQKLYKLHDPHSFSNIFDVAALSVNRRIVFEPTSSKFYLVDSLSSNAALSRRVKGPLSDPENPESERLSNTQIIAGGIGSSLSFTDLRVHYRVQGDWKSKLGSEVGSRNANQHCKKSVWTSWTSDDDQPANEFIDKFCYDATSWRNYGGQTCFAGIVFKTNTITPEEHDPEDPESPQPYTVTETLCGCDDYVSIQIKETEEPGQYMFTTRYFELPTNFLPTVVLANGESEGYSAIFKAPEGGLDASGQSGSSWSSEMCMMLDIDNESEIGLRRVYNHSPVSIEGDTVFAAHKIDGRWFAIVPGGGGAGLSFFRLDIAVADEIEVPATPCTGWAGTTRRVPNPNYDPNETIPDPEDPEGPEIPNPDYDPEPLVDAESTTVINWSGLLDGAPVGYVGMFAPVDHYEENPDYDPEETIPDPEDPEGPEIPNPDYDPRVTITRVIWAFAWGPCIIPEE